METFDRMILCVVLALAVANLVDQALLWLVVQRIVETDVYILKILQLARP